MNTKTGLEILNSLSGRSKKWLEDASPEEIKEAIKNVKDYVDQAKETSDMERLIKEKDEKIELFNEELAKRNLGSKYALFLTLLGGLITASLSMLLPLDVVGILKSALPPLHLKALFFFLVGTNLFSYTISSYITGRLFWKNPLRKKKREEQERDEIMKALYQLYEPVSPYAMDAHPIKLSKVIQDLKNVFQIDANLTELGRKIKSDPNWTRKQLGAKGKFLFVKFKKAKP